MFKTGARIKFLFGQPPVATAGLVGPVMEGDLICIGFDDGDLKQYSRPELKEKLEAKLIAPMDLSEGGLIKGEQSPPVCAFSTLVSGRMKPAIVGVLHGENGELMAGMPFYVAHTLCPSASRPSTNTTPKRSSARKRKVLLPPTHPLHTPVLCPQ